MVVLSIITTILIQTFSIAYELLDHNLISPFLTFARGFEFAIVFVFACIFLLISVSTVLRQAKKLPSSYSIHVTDLYGEISGVDGLRQTFATYDAAESYARFYGETYGKQYRFRVIGNSDHNRES